MTQTYQGQHIRLNNCSNVHNMVQVETVANLVTKQEDT